MAALDAGDTGDPPSPFQEITAGMFAGVCDAVASHPLDQVKTQHHINRLPNGSVLSSLQQQAAAGGISQLYRGLLAACLRPQALCMYTGNEWCKRLVAGPSGELTVPGAFLAGGLTGYVESASVTPFEVVKVRMQSLDHVGRYRSTTDCLKKMLREEGPAALYNGFWASCWRNCSINGTMFGLIFWSKRSSYVTLPEPTSAAGVVALDLGVGMAAAFVGTLVKMPFDVAKSRLQNQPAGEQYYRHTLQTCAAIWRDEGPRALYKGFTPTVMRIVLGQGVAFASFEFALKQLCSHKTALIEVL